MDDGFPARRPMVELRHLRLVQAVVREGGVTRAAGGLNLSQSALSHQLLNLERDLGARLFDRVGKKMSPTAAGLRLATVADQVLGAVAQAEQEIAQGLPRRTPLRVAASCHTFYGWLPQVLARFGVENPGLDVQVVFNATRRELEALAADEVDLVVTSRPPGDERFERRRLFDLEIVALVAADHELATDPQGVRWAALGGETLLVHDLPDEDIDRLRDSVREAAGAAPGQVWRVQLTEAIAALARAGHGIGVLTSWSDDPAAFGEGLARRPLRPRSRREFWAVWRRANPRDLPMVALSDFMTAALTDENGASS